MNREELKKKPEKNEAYNALCKVKDILNSPMTGLKLSIVRYCLAFSHNIILPEEGYNEAMKHLKRLEQTTQWHLIVRQLTNCSFLYGSK